MVLRKKNELTTKIFKEIDVVDINRKKLYRILKKMSKDIKVTKLPFLSKHPKKKCLNSVTKYIKIDDSNVKNMELYWINMIVGLKL